MAVGLLNDVCEEERELVMNSACVLSNQQCDNVVWQSAEAD